MGVRQGDPLSPYIFILAIDVLAASIGRAQSAGLIGGLEGRDRSKYFTHLFYVDDTLLLYEVGVYDVLPLKSIFYLFGQVLGLEINLMKRYGSLLGPTDDTIETQLVASMECEIKRLP